MTTPPGSSDPRDPTDAPVPRFAMVAADGARLHVRSAGSGPVVIAVHGGPDFDHGYLLPELDRLARARRVVCYDQRGRGRSTLEGPPSAVTLAREVADLERVRRWSGAGHVSVVAHSFGCVIALAHAIRHPDRVERLVLLNPAPVSRVGLEALRAHLHAARAPGDAATLAAERADPALAAGDIDADARYHRAHFAVTVRDPRVLEAIVGRIRRGATPEAIVRARAVEAAIYGDTWDRPDWDLLPALGALPMPLLVLHGERDLIPVSVAEGIAAAVPGARLEVVSGTGHFGYVESPDVVLGRVDAFLRAGR